MVLAAFEIVKLLLELDVALPAGGFEGAVVERLPHRAARFGTVPTVTETALCGERFDVLERHAEALFISPQLQLAHARGVDDDAAAGLDDQLAMRRGVAPAPVVLTHFADGELSTEEGVDKRGLADTGQAEQRDRGSTGQVLPQAVEALTMHGTDRIDRHTKRDRFDLRQASIDVVTHVGLVEHDDRIGPAVPGDGKVALDPPQVEGPAAVEATDEEHRVDIGGNDLLLRTAAGDLAREAALPRQHGRDGRLAFVRPKPDRHPVADGWQVAA